MSTDLSQEELARMAELDGEPAFDLSGLESGGIDSSFDDAMKFTAELRSAMAVGRENESVPDEWIDLIHNFQASEAITKVETKSFSWSDKVSELIESLLVPRAAFGGAFALAMGLGVVILMPSQPNWEDSYASLDSAISLVPESKSTFNNDYFSISRPVMRASNQQPTITERIANALQGEDVAVNFVADGWDDLAAPIRAIELNNKNFGLYEQEGADLWISIRGRFVGEDGQQSCQLIQISRADGGSPDESTRNLYLKYCASSWSEKVRYIGSSPRL